MRKTAWIVLLLVAACTRPDAGQETDIVGRLARADHLEGFVDLYRDAGHLYLRVTDFDSPFLYQTSMARGVGSNDLGLDRGQLGDTQVVHFERHGPRVLLVADNLNYRAVSGDADEQDAVKASFAESVLWGFDSAGDDGDAVLVDATDFFLRDAHQLGPRLKAAGEGDYSVDASRSAIYAPRTKAFPDNTEIEAIVTYTGEPAGEILQTVAPDVRSITVHLHHSFIRLPDDDYEPLPYDPRVGLIGLGYETDGFLDYASPIGDAMRVQYARRHRLSKKDPSAAMSEPVEPIVYYVERGAPEPVRSALLEGASWWNEAFEAAGYKNAFRVELLPEDADPMDVRYNVIQWVHRSTRGWSYGSSVVDPRSGEILKGHVTLGSLRVRQDYLIAEGLLAPYADDTVPDEMLEMSLARIRQLAAHEVGHTIGLEHNFAASTQGRSSVMDYPFPLIKFASDGSLDLSAAYGTGIGDWDKRVILYGYQDFPDGVDANAERAKIAAETVQRFRYVDDRDSRAQDSAHPWGNLWDNGSDAIVELEHLLKVRDYALSRFSAHNIRPGRPIATIEEVLVPIYLLHRYQVEAVGKLIGGDIFTYALRGDGQTANQPVSAARQRAALDALLGTLDPALLDLPDDLLAALPPRPPGFQKSRETFTSHTGTTFDPLGPAESAAAITLDVMLAPTRAARVIAAHANDAAVPGFDTVTGRLIDATWKAPQASGRQAEIQRVVRMLVLDDLLRLSANSRASTQVRAIALDTIKRLDTWLAGQAAGGDAATRAQRALARRRIAAAQTDPATIEALPTATVPPGSPIGDGPAW